ncbi:hypothetical protein SAMN02745163_02077 [Clostridium cavendishii DSM 21758]|uniref:Uncharacterized protein n=1 Tax=Clostridium cavendishii DSM 21758 TaxID=1121302 RepID=A0A1M6K267_9CLOT|nr:hypothetical protein [Clostridium cavendishii]SHJ53028.1 hypothetical protein SAMN02745163_02077 [Clostridium cavendishii DSM 21758]
MGQVALTKEQFMAKVIEDKKLKQEKQREEYRDYYDYKIDTVSKARKRYYKNYYR